MTIEEQAQSLSQEEIIGLLLTQKSFEEEKQSFLDELKRLDFKHSKELSVSNSLQSFLTIVSRETSELKRQLESLSNEFGKVVQDKTLLEAESVRLREKIAWFERQIFGPRTEKRIHPEPDTRQLYLGEQFKPEPMLEFPKETVKEHVRKRVSKHVLAGNVNDSGLRFGQNVPVKDIEIKNPEIEGLKPEEYEIINEKVNCYLAQNPSSYVVVRVKRKVIKLKKEEKIVCPKGLDQVFDRSMADVSFLSSMLVDKFCYHLPLYRQHQRILSAGIQISRSSLTNFVHKSLDLLVPISDYVLESILSSRTIIMDETYAKVGLSENGKMKTGYFWPVLGDDKEIVFLYYASRAKAVVREVLKGFEGVLITDGYGVYERFVEEVQGVVHAQCWIHTRRGFIRAEDSEPELSRIALSYISRLYKVEEKIKAENLTNEDKYVHRTKYSKPIVDEFFSWLKPLYERSLLLPSSPFSKAANYALDREKALRVFLDNIDVPLDTNEIERALRPIPMGRKNWLFCWTEIGAEYVAVAQTLIQSCRMQGVDPYTYLVDVLQRVATHPISGIAELTPKNWKNKFADNPLRSPIDPAWSFSNEQVTI